MTLQEQKDVIQAAIDGKPIELTESEKQNWRSCKPTLFNFGCYDYRVKPKPREFWLQEAPSTCDGYYVLTDPSKPKARVFSGDKPFIKVREVLE